MKYFFISLMLMLYVIPSHADVFTVSGKKLNIPAPDGFTRVTPEMDAIYRLGQQMVDPANDMLAIYIQTTDVPAAMSDNLELLERYFILKVNKKLKNKTLGSKDFAEIKDVTKKKSDEIMAKVTKMMPGMMDEVNQNVSKEFDINFALSVSQLVPLEPHYITNDIYAYAMYISMGVSAGGENESMTMPVGLAMVNVSGKLFNLYSYGDKNDIEWAQLGGCGDCQQC